LYRDAPGPLTDDQLADGLLMADVVARTVLTMQANSTPGQLVGELEKVGDFNHVVHQASGMVAVQLDIGVGEALIRLRAYAFGHDRKLADVARDVVARRLRFEPESDERNPVR
jgi:hypothetical protein